MDLNELRKSIKQQIKSGMDSAEIVRGLINQGLDKRQALDMVESASNELLRSPQITGSDNWWFLVSMGGLAAATVGGLIWALVVIFTQYELGVMAWGIGALCGFVVTLLAKGRKGLSVQLIAVVSSILGILIGKYGTFYHFVKETVIGEHGEEAARDLSWYSLELFEAFIAQIHLLINADDILWIILAVITAWNMPKRGNLLTAKKNEAAYAPDDQPPEREKMME